MSKLVDSQTKCLKAEREVTQLRVLRLAQLAKGMKAFPRGHLICTAVARGFKKRIKTGRCLEKRIMSRFLAHFLCDGTFRSKAKLVMGWLMADDRRPQHY